MTFPVGQIIATTYESRNGKLSDNLTAHNALFNHINKSGNVKSFSGGSVITEELVWAANGNAGSYSGADALTVNETGGIDRAEFDMKQYAAPIVFTGRDELMNAGKEKVIDLLEAKIEQAETSLFNKLNVDAYGDGTGNSSKVITGLAAAVSTSPSSGTYGSIDRSNSSYAFWRNKNYISGVDFTSGQAATSSTIINQLGQVVQGVTFGSNRPTVIIAGLTVYNLLLGATTANQRFMDGGKADAGFQSLDFQGIPVVYDAANASFLATQAYALNTKFLRLRVHKDRNFVMLKGKDPSNQDLTIETLVWAGNLTSSGQRYQAVYSSLAS
jgi:hypothetical protein